MNLKELLNNSIKILIELKHDRDKIKRYEINRMKIIKKVSDREIKRMDNSKTLK